MRAGEGSGRLTLLSIFSGFLLQLQPVGQIAKEIF
jgi:hypothetical protein